MICWKLWKRAWRDSSKILLLWKTLYVTIDMKTIPLSNVCCMLSVYVCDYMRLHINTHIVLWKRQIPFWLTLWGLICFGVTVIYFLTKLHDTRQFLILNNSTEHECEYRCLLRQTRAEYQCPDSGRIIRCHRPACWISKCPAQRKRADWRGWRGHSEGSNNEQKSVCWCFSKWKSQSVTNRQPCVFWCRTPCKRKLKHSFFFQRGGNRKLDTLGIHTGQETWLVEYLHLEPHLLALIKMQTGCWWGELNLLKRDCNSTWINGYSIGPERKTGEHVLDF